MKCPLAITLAAALFAAGAAAAQPLDKPPAVRDTPRGEAKTGDVAPPAAVEAPETAPPRREARPEARIEQRRKHGHVVEITVTPAGYTYSYTIQNREGEPPRSVQELSSGLSTPHFLKLEF
jgi:hypothetical protein